MSFSWDSAAPISLSCSRRRNRSSTVSRTIPGLGGGRHGAGRYLIQTAHLRHIGNSLKYLFDPVIFKVRIPSSRQTARISATRAFDQFLDGIGGDQQFMQADPACSRCCCGRHNPWLYRG